VTGLALAAGLRRPYTAPGFRYLWLALAAFVPQLLTGYLPAGRAMPANSVASVAVPLSMAGFLAFVWLNRRIPGMIILMAGLALNLLVISANGGWMPISPQTASQLPGGRPSGEYETRMRVGQKDVLIVPESTRLELLSDRYLVPDWLGYRAAFSLGDVLVAAGAFWLLASPPIRARSERSGNAYI